MMRDGAFLARFDWAISMLLSAHAPRAGGRVVV